MVQRGEIFGGVHGSRLCRRSVGSWEGVDVIARTFDVVVAQARRLVGRDGRRNCRPNRRRTLLTSVGVGCGIRHSGSTDGGGRLTPGAEPVGITILGEGQRHSGRASVAKVERLRHV